MRFSRRVHRPKRFVAGVDISTVIGSGVRFSRNTMGLPEASDTVY